MGRKVEYEVVLTEKEKDHLRKNTFAGKWDVRTVKRAQILLKADKSKNTAMEEQDIAREVGCNVSTVRNLNLPRLKLREVQ